MAFAYTVIRRFHGGALTAALALLALVGALPEPASATPPARPNVVVIVTDDQAAHTLRREVMPSLLDRIGTNATSFTNAIVTTPLCCPSRASMLAGQYGHIENIAPAPPGSPAAAREEDLAGRLATRRSCAGIAGRDPAPIGRTHCE
jgi:hypothetical protein